MYTMVVDGEYPSDIRVRKEAESLSLSGLEIQVVTRWKRGQKREEKINGVKVCRLGRNYSFRRKGLNDVLSSILFFDFLFYFQLKSFSRTNELGSIVHVHDLPLLRTIHYLFPKKYLVLDMHENYPEMLLALKLTPKSLMKRMKDRLFFSTKRWKRHEKYAIQLPNHIIAVVAEMKEKIIREYNIHSDKISVISNYEKLDFQTVKNEDDFVFNKEVFYLTYVGGISPVRGLEVGIDSVSALLSSEYDVQMIIIGSGNPSYIESLKKRANDKGISKKVHFLGRKPFEKIGYYIHNAGANIIPHIKNAHTDHTIPHKLFQIMMSKSPLLVSSCKPFKRIVGDSDAGFVFKAGDVRSFITQVRFMIENSSLVEERIQKSFDLVKNDMNWDDEAIKLNQLINELQKDATRIN